MNTGAGFLERIFNLGVESGMPRYVSLLGLLQCSVLFVPEATWTSFGVAAQKWVQHFPFFVQNYVLKSSFMNAMFVFWLISPVTLLVNTALCVAHVNGAGYSTYLARRATRLQRQRKTADYSLVFIALAFLALYVWGTGIYLIEPETWGNFVPPKSRWAMLVLHGSAIGLVLPVFLAVLATELRANFTN